MSRAYIIPQPYGLQVPGYDPSRLQASSVAFISDPYHSPLRIIEDLCLLLT